MQYRIRGGNPLYGAVSAQGSKNAVLPILFASLLVPCPVTLEQVPRLKDVEKTVLLLEDMGAKTDWQGNTLRICCEKLRQPSSSALPLLSSMRASSYLLGAGIARFGSVTLPWPGGCDFGTRPLNYHQFILSRMGAVWKETPEGVSVKAKELHGCEAVLPYPSVGATVNGVLAALGAKGTTLLKGCAKEKHVLCFLSFLKRCGADVVSLDGDTLLIRGQTALHGCRFRICPDGMAAGTYLIGA
ncbi:MAG: UDP-N-acetylglucosamine 1-carboxyvinyltransferase, partial [Clostridia bacterium]|nr:UDP-N-acetylglucosamine 1-carboxyvinyltransferase [Clostridia bacterium]